MEIEYRGWRIVEEEADVECHGFRMSRVFAVYDDLGDPLPILQNRHWSPGDAKLAIDFCIDVFALMKQGQKWPTTQTAEFNEAILYRRNFVEVYQALRRVELIAQIGDDGLGEDPLKAIEEELRCLRLRCRAKH